MKGKGFGFKFCQFLAVVMLSVVSYVLVFAFPVFAADKPVWRVLFAIAPQVDVTLEDGYRVRQTMTQKEIDDLYPIARRAQDFINKAAAGTVEFVFDVKVANSPVTTLTGQDGDKLYMEEDDFPTDIKALIQQAKDEDNPYQLMVANVRLYDAAYDPRITEAAGLTYGLYSMILLGTRFYDNQGIAMPIWNEEAELLWVHELLHGICNYFEIYHDFPMPDIHHPEYYGFDGSNGAGSDGNDDYYRNIFSRPLIDVNTGQAVGITPDMWQLLPSETVPGMSNPKTPITPDAPQSPTPTPDIPSSTNNSDGGGGGCDTGLPIYALVALLALRRKRS